MNEFAFTDEERTEVNRLIDAFIAGENPDPIPARTACEMDAICASESLPTLEDWSAFAAITRDCAIVWVDRDAPYSTRAIDDPRYQRFALFEASNRFPTLKSLLPKRPDDAMDCDHCDGTGRTSFGFKPETIQLGDRNVRVAELEDRIGCYCGGLGWLLDDE